MSSNQAGHETSLRETPESEGRTSTHTNFSLVDVSPVRSQWPHGSSAIPHTRPLIEVPVHDTPTARFLPRPMRAPVAKAESESP